MSTLARHVSYLEKALLLAIKHPNDFGIGADAALATAKHQILFDIAMRDIRTSSRQNFSDISLLVNFAGMLVRFFEVAVVQDKLGAENGVPLPLTIAAWQTSSPISSLQSARAARSRLKRLYSSRYAPCHPPRNKRVWPPVQGASAVGNSI